MSKMTPAPSRRTLLAGLAALPATLALPRPVLAQLPMARRVPYELVEDALCASGCRPMSARSNPT